MRQAVIIKPYDKKLPSYFGKERDFLIKKLGNNFEIHHIGSSAVPGLGGKNIVDIQLLAQNKKVAKKVIKKLKRIGYAHDENAGDKYRLFFSKSCFLKKNKVQFFLHLMWKSEDKYKEHLIFRDYLKKHSEEVKRYYILKKIWAKKAGEERKKYTKMKTSYVKEILKKARK
jgi:GrpB-like predicted nucleotidyltransferase (UPF0157 family)